MSVFFPAFATFRDDPERMAQAYCQAQAAVFAVGLPVGIGLAAIADPLVRLVLGGEWLDSIPIVQTLAPIYALQTITAMAAPVAMASGHTRVLFIRDLQAFAIRVPLMAIGMALYSLPGLLAAHLLAGLVLIPLNFAVARRAVGVKAAKHLAYNLRSLAAAAIMLAVVLTLDQVLGGSRDTLGLILRLTTLVSVGAVTYLLTHWLFWHALRRPYGPEHEVIRFCSEFLRRRRRRNPNAL